MGHNPLGGGFNQTIQHPVDYAASLEDVAQGHGNGLTGQSVRDEQGGLKRHRWRAQPDSGPDQTPPSQSAVMHRLRPRRGKDDDES